MTHRSNPKTICKQQAEEHEGTKTTWEQQADTSVCRSLDSEEIKESKGESIETALIARIDKKSILDEVPREVLYSYPGFESSLHKFKGNFEVVHKLLCRYHAQEQCNGYDKTNCVSQENGEGSRGSSAA